MAQPENLRIYWWCGILLWQWTVIKPFFSILLNAPKWLLMSINCSQHRGTHGAWKPRLFSLSPELMYARNAEAEGSFSAHVVCHASLHIASYTPLTPRLHSFNNFHKRIFLATAGLKLNNFDRDSRYLLSVYYLRALDLSDLLLTFVLEGEVGTIVITLLMRMLSFTEMTLFV